MRSRASAEGERARAKTCARAKRGGGGQFNWGDELHDVWELLERDDDATSNCSYDDESTDSAPRTSRPSTRRSESLMGLYEQWTRTRLELNDRVRLRAADFRLALRATTQPERSDGVGRVQRRGRARAARSSRARARAPRDRAAQGAQGRRRKRLRRARRAARRARPSSAAAAGRRAEHARSAERRVAARVAARRHLAECTRCSRPPSAAPCGARERAAGAPEESSSGSRRRRARAVGARARVPPDKPARGVAPDVAPCFVSRSAAWRWALRARKRPRLAA